MQVRHDADTGWHEQQRQVTKQAARCIAEIFGSATAQDEGYEQQRHANDRARDRQVKGDDGDFAHELVDEQDGHGCDH